MTTNKVGAPRTGYHIFKHYCGIKSHFNSNTYDYLKSGAPDIPKAMYNKRADVHMFERLARQNMSYVIPFLVANFVANKNLWVGNLVMDIEAEETYFEWRRKMSRIWSETEEELRHMKQFMTKKDITFDALFVVEPSSQPIIFKLMIQRYISLETYIILDIVLDFSKEFDRLMKDDVIYNSWALKIRKYKPFINADKKSAMNLIRDVFVTQ